MQCILLLIFAFVMFCNAFVSIFLCVCGYVRVRVGYVRVCVSVCMCVCVGVCVVGGVCYLHHTLVTSSDPACQKP